MEVSQSQGLRVLVERQEINLSSWQKQKQYASGSKSVRGEAVVQGWGKKVVPRFRELVPRGQRESGGGIHAT